jgi:hypothetical protein
MSIHVNHLNIGISVVYPFLEFLIFFGRFPRWG